MFVQILSPFLSISCAYCKKISSDLLRLEMAKNSYYLCKPLLQVLLCVIYTHTFLHKYFLIVATIIYQLCPM